MEDVIVIYLGGGGDKFILFFDTFTIRTVAVILLLMSSMYLRLPNFSFGNKNTQKSLKWLIKDFVA